MISRLNRMFLNEPVSTWRATYGRFDVPNFIKTLAATIISALRISLGNSLAERVAPVFLDAFSVNADTRDFLLRRYLPAVISS